MRGVEFAQNEYYHIYNRGVDKRDVFLDKKDYERFMNSINLLNDTEDGLMIEWRDYKKSYFKESVDDFLKLRFSNKSRNPLVEIIAYCLNPNHYHFILKQVQKKGIERFLHKLGTSYTKYFNKKNSRSGVLFQGVFKAIHIDSNEYLLLLSAYVNKNNVVHKYTKDESWEYSSCLDYLGKREKGIVKNKELILGQFKNINEYRNFINKNALYFVQKKEMQKYCLDD